MPNRARRCKSKWFHVVSMVAMVSRTRLSRVFFPTQARTVDKASNFSGKPTPTVTVSKRYKYACEQPEAVQAVAISPMSPMSPMSSAWALTQG